MIKKLLDSVNSKYKLTPLDVGEFSTLKANGMTFHITAYQAAGLGHISVMSAAGMLGLMKMDTMIINPDEKDLPFYSYDRIHAAGNDILMIELYDTCLTMPDLSSLETIEKEYSDLPDKDAGQHWYDSIRLPGCVCKKAKKKESAKFDTLAARHFDAYLKLPAEAPVNPQEKKKKGDDYVNRLLSNGGPATDVFIKKFGREKTERLFREVLF